ncbi:MAG: inorganic diphosphatase [Candidatus Micrarchaeaceae archaeon]
MKLDAGKEAPEIVNAFIEIPMGSNVKYEFDEESGVLKVDRILFTSMVYSINYGFIPGTWGEDNDPLDIMVISDISFVPGSYVKVRPIGIVHMEDEHGKDEKIVSVPIDKISQSHSNIRDVADLNAAVKNKIIHFFSHYKELEEGKWAKVTGFGGAAEAKKKIAEAIKRAKNR